MNILILAPDEACHGGVVNFIQQLTSNLSPNITTTRFIIGQRMNPKLRIPRNIMPFLDMVRLWRHVRRIKYDVYHLNPSLNGRSLLRDGLFLWVLKLAGAHNILVSFHGWEDPTQRAITDSSMLRNAFKSTYGIARSILVLAPHFADWLVNVGDIPAEQVHLFTTSFDVEPFNKRRRIRPDQSIHLIFMARLVREKGIYELLEATAMVMNSGLEISLVCAGNGPEFEGIRKWVDQHGLADSIHLPGHLQDGTKAQALLDADIFILPTYYGEGCPVAILEAMAAGLPVITTSVGGIPGIIHSGVNGILLECTKPSVIAEAIVRLLDQPDLCRCISEQNKAEAWEKYAAPVVAKQFELFYRSVVKDD